MAPAWSIAAAAASSVALVLQGCGNENGGGGIAALPSGSCGQPNTTGCDNVDFGSCGNACCNLILEVEGSPDSIQQALTTDLHTKGGSDGEYRIADADTGENGIQKTFVNLSQYSPKLPAPFTNSSSVWIGQVRHTTYGPKHYVDMINFNMRTGDNGSSIVHAFSLSLIGGALGDNGQNYKNIMGLLEGMKVKVKQHLNNSCPNPAQRAVVESVAPLSPPPAPRAPPAPKVQKKEEGTCGGSSPSNVTDCQNVDFGSCGNACCSLVIHQANTPTAAIQRINTTLSNGGPDGYYTLQLTAQGTLGYGNITALAPKLPSPFRESTDGLYIGQVHHMTSGPAHYNDTISFNVHASKSGGSYVRATSVSLIGGALGDNGQNYKNVMMILKGAFGTWDSEERAFGSCPPPSKSKATAASPVRVIV